MAQTLTASTLKYLEAGKASARVYRQAARGPASRRHDALAWKRFSTFLQSKDPWKASDEDVASWCAHLIEAGYSISTLNTNLSSLSYIFGQAGKGAEHGFHGTGTRIDNPAKSYLVRSTMRGIRRVHGAPPKKKLPLHLSTLDKLIDLQPDTLVGTRNKAMFSVMWAGALGGIELLNLNVLPGDDRHGFVEIHPDGLLLVIRRRIVTQSRYRWESHGIPLRKSDPRHCPTRLLIDWREQLGPEQGPLFPAIHYGRIRRQIPTQHTSINRSLKPQLQYLGLRAEDYSTRSFRTGCLEWLANEGVSPGRIMEHAGITSLQSVMRTVRRISAVHFSPLAQTKWSKGAARLNG